VRKLTSKITVDASNKLSSLDLDTIEGALARILRSAVAAATVQLADALGVEVLDGNGTGTIMLQYLVLGALGTCNRANMSDLTRTSSPGVCTYHHR
jgi:hypothetical protein